MDKYIKNINISMVCLIVFMIRLIIFGASVGDSIVLVGLAALFGFVKFTDKKQTDWMEKIEKDLSAVKNELQSARLNNSIIRKAHETKKPDDAKRWF